jgi:hypothetical protein
MPDKASISSLHEGDVAPSHIYVDQNGENPQTEPHERGAILVAEGDYVTAKAAAVLRGAKAPEAKGVTIEKVPPPAPTTSTGASRGSR